MSAPPDAKVSVHLFIGMPCYGGMIHVGCSESIRKLSMWCDKLGVGLTVATQSSESLITRGRNTLVAEFLGHPECTHLLFVDSDITFQPESVLHMLQAEKPVVAGCYPTKQLNLDRIRELAIKEPTLSNVGLLAKSMHYALNVTNDPSKLAQQQTTTCPLSKGYFLPVDEIATGFMLIQRGVLENMKRAFPEKEYVNDITGYDKPATKGNFFTFFDTIVHPDSKRYLSEDFAFCYLCKKIGVQVWADLAVNLTHTGVFNYTGMISTAIVPFHKPTPSPQAASSQVKS